MKGDFGAVLLGIIGGIILFGIQSFYSHSVYVKEQIIKHREATCYDTQGYYGTWDKRELVYQDLNTQTYHQSITYTHFVECCKMINHERIECEWVKLE